MSRSIPASKAKREFHGVQLELNKRFSDNWGFQESDNRSPTPVNLNYGKPVLRTQPTTFRLGVRLSF